MPGYLAVPVNGEDYRPVASGAAIVACAGR